MKHDDLDASWRLTNEEVVRIHVRGMLPDLRAALVKQILESRSFETEAKPHVGLNWYRMTFALSVAEDYCKTDEEFAGCIADALLSKDFAKNHFVMTPLLMRTSDPGEQRATVGITVLRPKTETKP